MTACSPPVWTSCGAGALSWSTTPRGTPPTALPTSASGSWSTTGSPYSQRQPLHLQAAELLSQGEQPQEGAPAARSPATFSWPAAACVLWSTASGPVIWTAPGPSSPSPPWGDAPAPRSPEELEEQTQQFLRELSALRREGADPAVLGRLELATALIQGRIALFQGTAPGAATSRAPSAAAASTPTRGCSSGPATCWPPPPLYRQATEQVGALHRHRHAPAGAHPGPGPAGPVPAASGAACSVSRAPMTRAATICWRPWTLCGDSPAPPRSGSSWRPSTVTTAGSAVSGWSTPTPAPTISGPSPLLGDLPWPGGVWVYVHYGRAAFALEDHPRARELFQHGYDNAKVSGELWGRTAASAYTAYYQAMEGGLRAGGGQLGRCPVLPAAAEFPSGGGHPPLCLHAHPQPAGPGAADGLPLAPLLTYSPESYARQGSACFPASPAYSRRSSSPRACATASPPSSGTVPLSCTAKQAFYGGMSSNRPHMIAIL